MRTHDATETRRLKSSIPFYDFEHLAIRGGVTYVIKAPEKYAHIRYGDIALGNCTAADYHELEEMLLNFFSVLLDTIDEKDCTIVRYEPKWVVRASGSSKLFSALKKNGVSDDVHGITVDKHDPMVKEFAVSSFRYNSFVQVLFPGRGIIITPTDHMDLFIDLPTSSSSVEQVELVLQKHRDSIVAPSDRT